MDEAVDCCSSCPFKPSKLVEGPSGGRASWLGPHPSEQKTEEDDEKRRFRSSSVLRRRRWLHAEEVAQRRSMVQVMI